MTGESFTEVETKRHRVARWTLVPWVCRLFGAGPLRGKADPLPISEPDALTQDTVAALGDIMNRAVWRFLAEGCGWRRLEACSPQSETHAAHRLWETRDPIPSLRFTHRSIDLILAAFNAAQTEGRIEDSLPAGAPLANGDFFVEHLIFRRLVESWAALGIDRHYAWQTWYAHPLNALHHVVQFGGCDGPPLDWSVLLREDVLPFFPWIGAEAAISWHIRTEAAWSGLDRFERWFTKLGALSSVFIQRFIEEGRPDLLGTWLWLFAHQSTRSKADLHHFAALTGSLSARRRQAIAKPWVEFLACVALLEMENARCHASHPIERTVFEKCFLAMWEAMDFSTSILSIRALSNQIRPSFSS